MKKIKIKASLDNISEGMKFIEKELFRTVASKKERTESIILAEEVLAKIIENAPNDSDISIFVSKFMGSTKIRISAEGEDISFSSKENYLSCEEMDSEEAIFIDNMLKRIGESRIEHKRVKNLNVFNIKVEVSNLKSIYIIMLSLIAGAICGLILKNISSDVANGVSQILFSPIYTMFLNALKLIVGPLVFFSVANSIAGFSDIRSLGRIAGKVFGIYVVTSFIAIGVGFIISNLIPIGDPSLVQAITDAGTDTVAQSTEVSISVIDTIVGIVPADIINPFLKSDMLAIIFIAVMLGISTEIVDREGAFGQFLNSADKVFSKLTSIVIGFMPIAVFCSMGKMMIGMNINDLMKVAVWVPSCYVGHFAMMVVYGILLFLFGRYNPFEFFKLYMPAIITGFTTSSSNATLPVSLRLCDEALKISPKVYSFSIPMGATINMDGSCITLVITAMFGARIFGIDIAPSVVIALVVAIISLSMGAPGVPGGNLVCIAILMPIIGIPAEAISLVMGLYPLVSMSQTAANVTGDAVVTTIVAKSEKLSIT